MLKKILLAAVFAATASFAQVSFGAHLGLGVNTLWGDDTEDIGAGVGFNVGGAAKISLPALPVTFTPQLLVDMRNFDLERGGTEVGITTWALDIPILVRFDAIPVLYIQGGPQFAFNLSTSSDEVGGTSIEDWYEFNTFEFDFVVGVGTGIVPFVDLDFRIVLGITDWMSEEKGMLGADALDMANMQFVLGATYWF